MGPGPLRPTVDFPAITPLQRRIQTARSTSCATAARARGGDNVGAFGVAPVAVGEPLDGRAADAARVGVHGEHVVEVAGLLPVISGEGVAVHRIAFPDNWMTRIGDLT